MKYSILFLFILIFSSSTFGQIAFQTRSLLDESFPTNFQQLTDIEAGDLDGDGDLDAVFSTHNNGMIAWCENLNEFNSFSSYNIISEAMDYVVLAKMADMDNDDDLDIVAIIGSNDDFYDSIVWYENLDGLATFGDAQIIESGIEEPLDMDIGDMNGDGFPDILCTYTYGNDLRWWESDGNGGFISAPFSTLNYNAIFEVKILDFDNDGDLDFLIGDEYVVVWFENTDGNGEFIRHFALFEDSNYLSGVEAADFDGDGHLDLMVGNLFTNSISWAERTNPQGYEGDFGPLQAIPNTSGYGVESIVAADVDNDGDQDVIIGLNVNTNALAWYENTDGEGNFTIRYNLGNGVAKIMAIDVADVDNDGDQDILTASFVSDPSKKAVLYENLADANVLQGYLSYDLNDNNCQTSAVPVPNMLVSTNSVMDSLSTFTNSEGFYSFVLNEGSFNTSAGNDLPYYFSVDPLSETIIFDGLGNESNIDFCANAQEAVTDLTLSLNPLTNARPGFEVRYQLVYENNGNTIQSGEISLSYDEQLLDSLQTDAPFSVQEGTVSFSYNDLLPFEIRTIELSFKLLPPPTVNIGDTLLFTSQIEPVIGDNTPNDNLFVLEQVTRGSYDPNDIAVLEGAQILESDLEDYLHYIIRFQNTGTLDAINVRVENTLDDRLDWNTIQLQSNSHPMRTLIRDGNAVSFIFDDIHLPDSTSNEPASHGFISYKIKPKTNLQLGDIIDNQASIYFDYNPPVITNTVSTEIVGTTNIHNANHTAIIKLYPNPSSGLFYLDTTEEIEYIKVYNLTGKLLLQQNAGNVVNLQELPSGLYICKLQAKDKKVYLTKVYRL